MEGDSCGYMGEKERRDRYTIRQLISISSLSLSCPATQYRQLATESIFRRRSCFPCLYHVAAKTRVTQRGQ